MFAKKRPVSFRDADKPKGGVSMGMLLKFATGAIGKWQKSLTGERRQKIRELFTVPRNDPHDPYKPNSQIETTIISEQPAKKELPEEETNKLQLIATSYDYCLPFDIIDLPHSMRDMGAGIRDQLNKLPTWMRAIILLRYEKIFECFGPRTEEFLRLLAERIDWQRTIPMKIFDVDENDDEADEDAIQKEFVLNEVDIEYTPKILEHKEINREPAADLFRVAHAIILWRMPKSARREWDPKIVHKCATRLRTAMLTRPTPAEIALAADEENIKIESEDESDEEVLYKQPTWRELVTEKQKFHDEIEAAVEKDFDEVPKEFLKYEESVAPRLQKKREKKKKKEEAEKERQKQLKAQEKCWARNALCSKRRAKQDEQKALIDRGLYRRYSRIWFKGCPKEEIAPTQKKVHHFRHDESFHAYIVELVSSKFFRMFIMFIIVFNAVILAFETMSIGEWDFGDGVDHEREISICFQVLDVFFLSIYLAEFIVKVYAHPRKYWRSGFNIFDFIVLVTSLLKIPLDWFSVEIKSQLGIIGGSVSGLIEGLVLIRTLRILRGVSINVQIQVLVTALVETLKTHVLSVLVLLILVLYICSIIAFYLFGRNIDDWEDIGIGMLNLFAFVTMDGWTNLLDNFVALGGYHIHVGRIFCLVGILLGNFIFSNIFIAIIIMQISDATDAFRQKQTELREKAVQQKKDVVFRRQKLDMRQLLSKQKFCLSVDFYMLAAQFQSLLRHDDVVDMKEVVFSPLWIDCMHKTSLRCLHTSNMIMNLHRQAADNLLDLYNLYQKGKYDAQPIRRARYNRCLRLKAKLTILKNELYEAQPGGPSEINPLKVRLPSDGDEDKTQEQGPLSGTIPRQQGSVDTKGSRPVDR